MCSGAADAQPLHPDPTTQDRTSHPRTILHPSLQDTQRPHALPTAVTAVTCGLRPGCALHHVLLHSPEPLLPPVVSIHLTQVGPPPWPSPCGSELTRGGGSRARTQAAGGKSLSQGLGLGQVDFRAKSTSKSAPKLLTKCVRTSLHVSCASHAPPLTRRSRLILDAFLWQALASADA